MNYQNIRFPGGKTKALTFSYDDGCRADVRMAKTLTKYGLKGTFNLNNSDAESRITKEEVKELILDKGHEVAIHGAYHRAEGIIRPIEGIKEVLDCRRCLEERYGIIIRGMAYPNSGIRSFENGTTYEMVKQYLTQLDVAYARTLGGDNDKFRLPDDWHAWMPTAHHRNPNIMQYIDAFLSKAPDEQTRPHERYPRLFYIWGHSYEFDNNNNWELLDAICEKFANREDIWYATNIEIYEYVEAYNLLRYSANGDMIYNPTLKKIWIDISGEIYSINPGETLKLDK